MEGLTITHPYSLAARHTTLHAALDALLVAGEFETAAHLARTLGGFWETHEFLYEGLTYLSPLLDSAKRVALPPSLIAGLHQIAGNLQRHQSHYPQAAGHYEAGLALVEREEDDLHVRILIGMGENAFRQGDYDSFSRCYRQFLAIGEAHADATLIADAYNALGRVAAVRHQFAEAQAYHEAARALAQRADYPYGLAWFHNSMGELRRTRRDYHRATDDYHQSARLFVAMGNPGAAALTSENLAFVRLALGDVDTAERDFLDVLGFWRRGDALHGMALCLVGLAGVWLARGRTMRAASLLAFARRILCEAGVQLELGDHDDEARISEQVRDALGYAAYADVVHRTAQLTLNQVLAQNDLLTTVPRPTLSPREVEILRLVAEGMSDRQIAARARITPHTVNAHLRAIYRKLDVNNRTGAVFAARLQALI